MNNNISFKTIKTTISKSINKKNRAIHDNSIVIHGDSLDILKKIPSNSISLILTDPPYHSTKKKNIAGDTAFKKDEHFIEWIRKYSIEWRRILRPNGAIYMYCSSQMAAHLEVMLSHKFNILSNIVWTKPNEPGFEGWKQKMKKESLRQWYAHTERIIFATPAQEGNLHRSYFANFLKEKRKESGLSGHQLTEIIGAHGKINHGGAVSNWETGRNIPNREQYSKICQAFINTGKIQSMPHYEDLIRAFSVHSKMEYTDVWNFPSVRPYKGKHPAEKPLSMLEHIIQSSTFDNDIILDCFAGSGSTAIASLKLDRFSISIELEKVYYDIINKRLKYFDKNPHASNYCMKSSLIIPNGQLTLSL